MYGAGILRFFYLVGCANSLFFSVLVFSRKEKTIADKILGYWLLALSLQLFLPFLYLANINLFIHIIGFETILAAIHPILLYNYTRALTQTQLTSGDVIKSLWPMLFAAASMLRYVLLDPSKKIEILSEAKDLPIDILIPFLLEAVIFIYFLRQSFKILRRHKNNVLQLYSYRDDVDLLWLRRLLLFFTLFLLSTAALVPVLYIYDISLAYSDFIFYASLTIFIFLLGYWGYQQGNVFSYSGPAPAHEVLSQHRSVDSGNGHSNESNLDAEAAAVLRFMKSHKPHLDSTITLYKLAEQIDMPPHQLSRIINRHFHKNFFEFVNEYRISAFKEKLVDTRSHNYTLLSLAFESGFNSKSAFNRIFKEYTGLTPQEYKSSLEA